MTDKELLELAAKAAGKRNWQSNYSYLDGHCDSEGVPYWNPLTDDGDALRLLVKLSSDGRHINAFLYPDELTVFGPNEGFLCRYRDDPCLAVRRAIVHAAAGIGRDMP